MKKSLGAKTILYPAPVLVIGTYDKEDRPNVMTAAWGGICCSSPPCVAVALRKATYTYGNIVLQGGFTINIPSEQHVIYKEFPFVLECKLIQQIEIGLHTQFIGEILDIKADKGVLDQNGQMDIEKVKPILYAPEANIYYDLGTFLGNAFSIGQEVKKKPWNIINDCKNF